VPRDIDPQQDYFSDGMTEDITTELSRFSELVVIARNSAFQYKGKAVDIRQVGRELGARYVLEGSVRRSGDHVRGATRTTRRKDECLHRVCAVIRRRFPVGASPTRRTLQPEAAGAAMEVTKWLKPSESVSRIGDSASVQAVTRVNAEQASKRTMRRPTR
jgi:hypothetical protein